MPSIDFVYDRDCPNATAARANLVRAFSLAGMPAHWVEHEVGSMGAPAHVRGFGSPTILVDGVDIDGWSAGAEDCCRVYNGQGAPSVNLIADALAGALQDGSPSAQLPTRPRSRWNSAVAVLPGIGITLLPKVVCPLCWPVYAGVLSAAGLAFLMEDRFLLPISAVLLLAAISALAWRADSRRGYGPLGLGAAAAAAALAGRFAVDSTTTVYTGVVVLFAAGLWNAWPRRASEPSCSGCHAGNPEWHPDSHQGEDQMNNTTIEVFSAGCPACEEAIDLVNAVACPSCEVSILDMRDTTVAKRAGDLGISRVPAVVVNGVLAECCAGAGPTEAGLRAAGVGGRA